MAADTNIVLLFCLVCSFCIVSSISKFFKVLDFRSQMTSSLLHHRAVKTVDTLICSGSILALALSVRLARQSFRSITGVVITTACCSMLIIVARRCLDDCANVPARRQTAKASAYLKRHQSFFALALVFGWAFAFFLELIVDINASNDILLNDASRPLEIVRLVFVGICLIFVMILWLILHLSEAPRANLPSFTDPLIEKRRHPAISNPLNQSPTLWLGPDGSRAARSNLDVTPGRTLLDQHHLSPWVPKPLYIRPKSGESFSSRQNSVVHLPLPRSTSPQRKRVKSSRYPPSSFKRPRVSERLSVSSKRRPPLPSDAAPERLIQDAWEHLPSLNTVPGGHVRHQSLPRTLTRGTESQGGRESRRSLSDSLDTIRLVRPDSSQEGHGVIESRRGTTTRKPSPRVSSRRRSSGSDETHRMRRLIEHAVSGSPEIWDTSPLQIRRT